MDYKYLPQIDDVNVELSRSSNPIYKSEVVLSTGYLQNRRAITFLRNLQKLRTNFPNAWFIHYHASGDDAKELAQRVPKCFHALNRSRVLRRERVSGVRACIVDISRRRPRYISDLAFTNFNGAAIIASGLFKFLSPTYFVVSFRTPLGMGKREVKNLHRRFVDKFFSYSKLSSYSVNIHDITDEGCLPCLTWRVETPSMDLLTLITAIVDIFRLDVEEFTLQRGDDVIKISRSILFDPDKYSVRPFDKLALGFRYRQFSSYGTLCRVSEYMIY
ncbi:MAG: hypothetical protein II299_00965 [Alistipes sp.]|nr:hypothetical protein [Alistipes sp.]